MNYSLSGRDALVIAVFTGLGLPSIAQALDASHNPAANVPVVTYHSIFGVVPLGMEQGKIDWRKANDDVARFPRGHLDIVKQEELDSRAAQPKAALPAPHTPHKH